MKQFYENKEVLRELHDDIACHIASDEPLKQSNCNEPPNFSIRLNTGPELGPT